jgi:hypothetical protein
MDHRARRRASTLDRLLLALAALVLLAFAYGLRNHRTTSTFALTLAGVAALLAVLALVLPFLTGPQRPRRTGLALTYEPAPDGRADPAEPPAALDAAYTVVALGYRWPPSRLLGHAVVPRLVGGTRWLVFLAADGRYLGIAGADDLRQRFARAYPALEPALAAAWASVDHEAPDPTRAKGLYVELLEAAGGRELPLTADRLAEVLGDALDTRSVRSHRSPARLLADVLAVPADRVAIVGSDGRLVGVVDRRALLEELARRSP